LRAFERAGWRIVRQSGSHAVLRNDQMRGRLVIPMHARRILKPGTLSGLIADAELSVEEFTALL
jgi:predicted RNA binding protein YcfA (HicA-like mRNA interferase family)